MNNLYRNDPKSASKLFEMNLLASASLAGSGDILRRKRSAFQGNSAREDQVSSMGFNIV
jgi:hypothetical protein